MVSRDANWLGFHNVIYKKMLGLLKERPPQGLPDDFLRNTMPKRMLEAMGPHHCYVMEGTKAVYRPAGDGEIVKYWDGATLTERKYSSSEEVTGDYFALARKLVGLAEAASLVNPIVVDVGAGMCQLSVALRAIGCGYRVLNIDIFQYALEIGQVIANSLGLSDIWFYGSDLSAAVEAAGEMREQLRSNVLACADGRPLIINSRVSIHPFYSASECQKLFDFLLHDIGAKAGQHLEMCGYHTMAYQELCRQFGETLSVSNKTKNVTDDPLLHLESLPTVAVQERLQIWPHYVTTWFPSYLSWKLAA